MEAVSFDAEKFSAKVHQILRVGLNNNLETFKALNVTNVHWPTKRRNESDSSARGRLCMPPKRVCVSKT